MSSELCILLFMLPSRSIFISVKILLAQFSVPVCGVLFVCFFGVVFFVCGLFFFFNLAQGNLFFSGHQMNASYFCDEEPFQIRQTIPVNVKFIALMTDSAFTSTGCIL